MFNDLTFFTNTADATLLERFKSTLRFVQYFDVLVGYFRASGFYLLEDALAPIEKIRILVGLNVDEKSYEIIENHALQPELNFESHAQVQENFAGAIITEMEHSGDRPEIDHGVGKFIAYLESGKLEIRAHPSQNIHAKVYISRFNPNNSPDFGRVITGSSNFSRSGFVDQYEFNVELKNRSDVDYALQHFEQLWAESVELNQTYVDTIRQSTWLNDQITPYELYLKLLYEYFKEDINADQEVEFDLPAGFMELAYQKQAVVAAKKVLEAYNGVFLSDVVGLGKTFIAALLAQQLPGRKLVICPPVLIDYWKETFFQFGIRGFQVESLGKLEHILQNNPEKYQYIFVDEAHRFRNEITQAYEQLHRICWGKKVILVSATPLNNTINDIYAQLKLFQPPRRSLIPGLPNLEQFFSTRTRELKRLKKGTPEYVAAVKAISAEIRERILKYVMVRRTRAEIARFFQEDMRNQGLAFPTLDEPHKIVYQFDPHTNAIFNQTIDELQAFRYARYTPLLYSNRPLSEFQAQSQRNVGGFMKGVLVKRLESSFFAFRRTLDRFIESYQRFIDMYRAGAVYISDTVDVFDLLDRDDEDELLALVVSGRVDRYSATDFRPEFLTDLAADLDLLQRVRAVWDGVKSDPKLAQFIHELRANPLLAGQKAVVFTESAETCRYLYEALEREFPQQVMAYTAAGGRLHGGTLNRAAARETIRQEFDPAADAPSDALRLLVTTDVLAEGINLHRSNTVINYDLPWNPTRVLQRVGRVNRVGTRHNLIEIFNFFPTAQSDSHLGLENNIKAKLYAFQNLLGEDARYLTDEEEIGSFALFGEYLYRKLNDRTSYEGPEEQERSELEYLQVIRQARDRQPELYARLKRLPKKARSAKRGPAGAAPQLVTFFRRGRLKKFFLASAEGAQELTFLQAADRLRCAADTPRAALSAEYFPLLDQNKQAFAGALAPEDDEAPGGGHSNEQYVLLRLKSREVRRFTGFTDEDEAFLRRAIAALEAGLAPRLTSRRLRHALEREEDPLRILQGLRAHLPEATLDGLLAARSGASDRREVILSELFPPEA